MHSPWNPARPPLLREATSVLALAWLVCAPVAGAQAPVIPAAPETTVAEQPPADPSDVAALAAYLDGEASRLLGELQVAGAAVGLIVDGETVLLQGYGLADVEAGEAVTPDTPFHAASVGKMLTWTVLAQLIEANELDPDAAVAHYLDLELPVGAGGEQVRVRHLPSHTAGFEDRPVIGVLATDPERLRPLRETLIATTPRLHRQVGAEPAYSNWSAGLAGLLVQETVGAPYASLVEDRVLTPLAAAATFVPRSAEEAARTAQPYVPTQDGLQRVPFEFVPIAPAGGFVASLRDLTRFAAAHLNDGVPLGATEAERILPPGAAARMREAAHLHPDGISGVAAGGWWLSRSFDLDVVHHLGDTLAYHALLALVPERNAALVVLTNTTTGGAYREALRVAFLRALAGADQVRSATEPGPGADRADPESHVGLFASNRQATSTVGKLLSVLTGLMPTLLEGDALSLPLPTGELAVLRPVAEQAYVDPHGGGRVTFASDVQGQRTVHLSDVPMFVYRETSGATAPTTLISVLAMSFVVALIAAIAWPIGARRARRRDGDPPAGSRPLRIVGGATATVIVLFGLSLVMVAAAPLALAYGLTLPMLFALLLGTVLLVAAPATIVLTVVGMLRGHGRRGDRMWGLIVSVASGALAVQVWIWNLFGTRI